MSVVLVHSATAISTFEYTGKKEYAEIKPKWIKEKQLLGYYNSMNRFYAESLDELEIPKRFNREELQELLITRLKESLNKDKDFRDVVIKLCENYPSFPLEANRASNYVSFLRRISRIVAMVGSRLNEEYASDSIKSDVPYIVFGNLILGNYAISSFHDYKAKVTEQDFRRHLLLIRGRPNLRARKIALKSYFQMMKPTEELFQKLLKAQFKLWLLMALSNVKDLTGFIKGPRCMRLRKINQKQLAKLINEHAEILEKFRRYLFQLEPDLFKPLTEIDEPTQTMWRDMILLNMT